MGWVTLSLRKMVLTQRISNLETRLTQISQQRQSLANNSAYSERFLAMMKNRQYSDLQSSYMSSIKTNTAPSDPTSQAWAEYQQALDMSALNYQRGKMSLDSVFGAYEQGMQDEVNRQDQQLELEQQQLQAQLSAARAEQEQMDKAMDQDIKDGAIKLV